MNKLLITNEQWALLDYLVKPYRKYMVHKNRKEVIDMFMGHKLVLNPNKNSIDLRDIPVDCVGMINNFRNRILKEQSISGT